MTTVTAHTWTEPGGMACWDVDIEIDVEEGLVFHIKQYGPGSDRAYRSAIEAVADALLAERRRHTDHYNAGWEDCMENYGLS